MNGSRDQKRFYENFTKILEAIESYNIALYNALKDSIEKQVVVIVFMGIKLKIPNTMVRKLKNIIIESFIDVDKKARELHATIRTALTDLR